MIGAAQLFAGPEPVKPGGLGHATAIWDTRKTQPHVVVTPKYASRNRHHSPARKVNCERNQPCTWQSHKQGSVLQMLLTTFKKHHVLTKTSFRSHWLASDYLFTRGRLKWHPTFLFFPLWFSCSDHLPIAWVHCLFWGLSVNIAQRRLLLFGVSL